MVPGCFESLMIFYLDGENNKPNNGIYIFTFYYFGEWHDVVIDDRLPLKDRFLIINKIKLKFKIELISLLIPVIKWVIGAIQFNLKIL